MIDCLKAPCYFRHGSFQLAEKNSWRNDMAVSSSGRVEVISNSAIRVNLDESPINPSGGAIPLHAAVGWIIVENHDNQLYVDGRRVVLRISDPQRQGSSILTDNLLERFIGQEFLGASILVALKECPHLIPNKWRNCKSILFCDTIFLDQQGKRFLCYLFPDIRDSWSSRSHWFADLLSVGDYVACLET